jgi:hypothetical protein
MGWGGTECGARCWGIAGSKVFVDLAADCRQLTLLQLGDADAAPVFGGANKRGVDELQNGTLAKGIGDYLGAPARLPEQPIEQIGGSDRPTMAKRETQMRDARLEIVVETHHRRRQILAIVAMSSRSRRANAGEAAW